MNLLTDHYIHPTTNNNKILNESENKEVKNTKIVAKTSHMGNELNNYQLNYLEKHDKFKTLYKIPSYRTRQTENKTKISKEAKQARILIAESEPDILSLFKKYLDTFGLDTVTADNGETALNRFLEDKNSGKSYDIVILDTNLKGISLLYIVKEIKNENPNQKIILTTTTQRGLLSKELLDTANISDKDVFVKPSRISELLSKIKQ